MNRPTMGDDVSQGLNRREVHILSAAKFAIPLSNAMGKPKSIRKISCLKSSESDKIWIRIIPPVRID